MVKRINFDQSPVKFKGKSGTEYTVLENVSAGRWNQFEIERLGVTLGFQADEIYNKLYSVYEQLEEGKVKLATAAVQLYDLMAAIKDMDEKRIPVLRLSALICHVEGEEVGKLSEEAITKKIDDFEEISIDDFFFLVLSYTPKYQESLKRFLEKDKEMSLMKKK